MKIMNYLCCCCMNVVLHKFVEVFKLNPSQDFKSPKWIDIMPSKNIAKFRIWDQAWQRLGLLLFSEDFFPSHLLVLLLQGLGSSCAALCWPEFRTFSPCWPSRPPPPLCSSSLVPFLLRLGTCPVHWTDLFFGQPE